MLKRCLRCGFDTLKNPPDFYTSIGYTGVIAGLFMIGNRDETGWSGPVMPGTSLAAVLFSPGFSKVTIQGQVIRFRD